MALSVDALRLQWMGRTVRTSRQGAPSGLAGLYDGDKEFGGEGKVVNIYKDEQGLVWLEVDWGMAWIVDEETTFTPVGEESNSGVN